MASGRYTASRRSAGLDSPNITYLFCAIEVVPKGVIYLAQWLALPLHDRKSSFRENHSWAYRLVHLVRERNPWTGLEQRRKKKKLAKRGGDRGGNPQGFQSANFNLLYCLASPLSIANRKRKVAKSSSRNPRKGPTGYCRATLRLPMSLLRRRLRAADPATHCLSATANMVPAGVVWLAIPAPSRAIVSVRQMDCTDPSG